MEYKTIIAHGGPDFDTGMAAWLLKKFGSRHFPGIENARIEYIDKGASTWRGLTADQAEAAGAIMVDVGQGRFDHHAGDGKPRDKKNCAATLVAKHLGVDTLPQLQKTLDFVLKSDTSDYQGEKDWWKSAANRVAAGHSNEAVMAYMFDELNVDYESQDRLFLEAMPLYEAGQRRSFTAGSTTYKLLLVRADNPMILAAARMAFRTDKRCDVLIVENQSGRIQLFPIRGDLKNAMRLVVGHLRYVEAHMLGQTVAPTDLRLFGEAKLPEVPIWHFQVERGYALNGAIGVTNVVATRHTLATAANCVEKGIQLAATDPGKALLAQLAEAA